MEGTAMAGFSKASNVIFYVPLDGPPVDVHADDPESGLESVTQSGPEVAQGSG